MIVGMNVIIMSKRIKEIRHSLTSYKSKGIISAEELPYKKNENLMTYIKRKIKEWFLRRKFMNNETTITEQEYFKQLVTSLKENSCKNCPVEKRKANQLKKWGSERLYLHIIARAYRQWQTFSEKSKQCEDDNCLYAKLLVC